MIIKEHNVFPKKPNISKKFCFGKLLYFRSNLSKIEFILLYHFNLRVYTIQFLNGQHLIVILTHTYYLFIIT